MGPFSPGLFYLCFCLLIPLICTVSSDSESDSDSPPSPVSPPSPISPQRRPAYGSSSQTPCMRELGENGDGRYPTMIALQFPGMILLPGDNMICECDTEVRMTCTITVIENSVTEEVILRRLDRTNLNSLVPFFLDITPDTLDPATAPICFEMENLHPTVRARILVNRVGPSIETTMELSAATPGSEWTNNTLAPQGPLIPVRTQSDPTHDHSGAGSSSGTPPPIRRTNSTPAASHYPQLRVLRRQCDPDFQSHCPIMYTPFQVGDIVYIRARDRQAALNGAEVVCFSAEGLRNMAMQSPDGVFIDPLRRDGLELTSLAEYEAYVITDEAIQMNSVPGGLSNELEIASPNLSKSLSKLCFIFFVMVFIFATFHISFHKRQSFLQDDYVQLI